MPFEIKILLKQMEHSLFYDWKYTIEDKDGETVVIYFLFQGA